MTDHKDDLAPYYILAAREAGSDDMDAGTFCSVGDGGTKYILYELHQSQIKAAEAAALRKAAWVCTHHISTEEDASIAELFHEEILALISDDQQSALDAALLAAKEEGFWIGRSTGGSRAEIDAAIRAMKEGW